ncbi:43521_t:CDS:2, partial [Gigaspora margarita]
TESAWSSRGVTEMASGLNKVNSACALEENLKPGTKTIQTVLSLRRKLKGVMSVLYIRIGEPSHLRTCVLPSGQKEKFFKRSNTNESNKRPQGTLSQDTHSEGVPSQGTPPQGTSSQSTSSQSTLSQGTPPQANVARVAKIKSMNDHEEFRNKETLINSFIEN